MDFSELYQFLFIGSILYMMSHIFMFTYRFVRRVRYKIETAYDVGLYGKVLIWLSITIFLTYLI
jgi:hypothetical protein